ncbi:MULTISPECIES: murein biosynthesis integral membrane protein MurJ [unclassified Sphingobium]|uniref:murein biosynthesis integral membrane protein MurJ n=1 Tax=unclassified Sphingobium TaxID=2611147 RepID=UPI0022240C4F|nr:MULTISPECIES: murein biosynthesis integral membrane protein MurJ [unclassified Sphingobium]MCW2395674.1 putative peptidoglycan lipid II flippase [Sphingobium sp. B8D3B]MCW2419189.1 putative peptidoglycan lipid II flippase [Sphingobium sp. B8D3C]
MSLLRSTGTIGALTLVSRVLGMVRDMLMARYVGAGFASDAFLIAWRLPNLFRALFAEGAFSAAFVPMFNRIMGKEGADNPEAGRAAAIRFAGQVLSVLFPILVALTIVMMLAAGPVVWAMTGGFPDGGPEKFALARHLTIITFPYLGLISLTSLLGGILNSFNRFWVNAAAPSLLNLCMIGALLFFRGDTEIETAVTQAIAVTVSGAMQLLWLIWSCRRIGVALKLSAPRLSPQVKAMLLLIAPAAIGQGAIQINLLISTSLAARFLPQGSVSWIYYADRLNQLPLGLIGIGVGTAMLPLISRQIGAGDTRAANETQNRALELALFLALPAAIALFVSAVPIIRGVFQHGAFTAEDTLGAAAVLAAFAPGVPAYVLIKVLTPGFYARADTKTPVRIAFIAMLVNLVGNLTLIWRFGAAGIAASTALSAWVNVALLYWTLSRKEHLTLDARFRAKALRIVAAGALMGAALWAGNQLLDAHMAAGFWRRLIALGLLCGGGGLVYAIAAIGFGAYRIAELKAQLRRRPR